MTQSKDTLNGLSHLTSQNDLKWHHIPPRAPHFGRLWEAGVMSILAKILKLYPGSDGLVRTVDLLCNGKEYKCPICSLIPFFNPEDENTRTSVPRRMSGTQSQTNQAGLEN